MDWEYITAFGAKRVCSEEGLESRLLYRQKLQDGWVCGGESGTGTGLDGFYERHYKSLFIGWPQVICWCSFGKFPATVYLSMDSRNWFTGFT